MSTSLPVIDLSLARSAVARQLDLACSEFGFFYLVGHEVGAPLTDGLLALAREFFARDRAEKMQIHMSRGGRAWRGYFPVGGELTSGQPDLKEGLYFGSELDDDDPRVRAGTPMHGRNLFPDVPQFRAHVLDYMSALEARRAAAVVADGRGAASAGRLFSAPLHCRSDGALQDLPLSARRSCTRRLGRRCAHGLWIAHTARAGCGRRAAGPESRPLARRAAARGLARLQRRRHAGAADQRPLSLGTASREEL